VTETRYPDTFPGSLLRDAETAAREEWKRASRRAAAWRAERARSATKAPALHLVTTPPPDEAVWWSKQLGFPLEAA
jgi:hypothetical protein